VGIGFRTYEVHDIETNYDMSTSNFRLKRPAMSVSQNITVWLFLSLTQSTSGLHDRPYRQLQLI
jgi:hypothetical protein